LAVEPNADMRRQLIMTLGPFPNAKVIDGTAEATTLPDHSVDIVTVAHALHWFDLDFFRKECRRIVKPGGSIIAIYNLSSAGARDLYEQTADAFFAKPMMWEFPNPLEYTRDNWLAYIASQDGYPLLGDPGYEAHIAAINAGFDRDSVDGVLHCDRTTKVYAESVLPAM